jgi:hypothetical protein
MVLAHRYAYAIVYGPIPNGKMVCHHCDTPSCVRIDHLFLTDAAGNSADMVSKGRQARGNKHGTKRYPEKIPRGFRNGASKLTENAIRTIRVGFLGGITRTKLAEAHGITYSNVCYILRGKTWKHVI